MFVAQLAELTTFYIFVSCSCLSGNKAYWEVKILNLILLETKRFNWFIQTGYGFVDFESPTVAQKAVTALKNKGIQAQMAKVSKCGVVLFTVLPVNFLHQILIIFVVRNHAVIYVNVLFIYYRPFWMDYILFLKEYLPFNE